MANAYSNQIGAPQVTKAVNPSVNGTHQSAIRELQGCLELADSLLNKMRGAHPHENEKMPEEMPSVMANASKLNQLAQALTYRLKELYEIIGE